MLDRCVLYGCNNKASLTKCISLYRIPYWDNERQEAKRRKKWLDYILRKRVQWKPSLSSVVCFEHSKESYFDYGSATVGKYKVPKIKRNDIGIIVVPTLQLKVTCLESKRSKRIQRRKKARNNQ